MFQYVSIISVSTIPSRILFPRFTFQYVSIISKSPPLNPSPTAIYIPICFYYFALLLLLLLQLLIHLHSNMFLLFPSAFLSTSSSVSDLHSNMFLLFLESSQSKRFVKFIYIPICFYYFLPVFLSIQEWDKFTFQYVSIISEQTRKLNTEHFLFTFQYVSIISIGTEKDWDAFKQFTFQYVSIISLGKTVTNVSPAAFTFQYVSIIS